MRERIRKVAAEQGLDKKWGRDEWKWDYGVPLWLMQFGLSVAAAERDAETEHCVKLLENSVDSVHTAHHSRDYCDGFLQGRKNLRETIVAAIRSRVTAKEKK